MRDNKKRERGGGDERGGDRSAYVMERDSLGGGYESQPMRFGTKTNQKQ